MNHLDAFDAICLTLSANNGEITGRTVLQKLIYFETIKISEIKLSEPYFAYFYGPFNKSVANSLGRMVFYGILSEDRVKSGYTYKIAPKGEEIVKKTTLEFAIIFKSVKSLVKTCKQHCNLDPDSMSFAAKLHYMQKSQEITKYSESELVALGDTFGWEISKNNMKKGFDLLRQLNLVNNIQ